MIRTIGLPHRIPPSAPTRPTTSSSTGKIRGCPASCTYIYQLSNTILATIAVTTCSSTYLMSFSTGIGCHVSSNRPERMQQLADLFDAIPLETRLQDLEVVEILVFRLGIVLDPRHWQVACRVSVQVRCLAEASGQTPDQCGSP